MIKKSKRTLELAASFWIGIGLMSIINIWKINQNRALQYSWMMFGVSLIAIIVCVILIKIDFLHD